MGYLAFLRLALAAEATVALAFILVGEPGPTDLDLPRDRSTDSERKRVRPRGLQVTDETGMSLAALGGGGWIEKESVAEMGVLGS